LHHVHSANFSYQNPYYGQVGHHTLHFPPQQNYNNGGMHNQVPAHNYHQSNNYHYNHPQQVYNQQYGNIHNLNGNQTNGTAFTPSYHHPQQNLYQGVLNGHTAVNGTNPISHNINMNLNLNETGSTTSEQTGANKHWTEDWK
jgi:hypothetical protein